MDKQGEKKSDINPSQYICNNNENGRFEKVEK